MGSIEKIGDDYYIEFYARGLKYQQKVGPDRAAAERALAAIEEQIARGEAALIVRDVEVDIFFQDFLKNACLDHTFKTIGRYAATIEHFKMFLLRECPSLKRLSEITPRVVEQYKTFLIKTPGGPPLAARRRGPRPRGPKVVNLTLFLLRDVLDYGIKLGYINDNPTLHVRLAKQPAPAWLVIPSSEDIERLIGNASGEFAGLLEFMILTGLTLLETVDLQWTDVHWESRYLQVGGRHPRKTVLTVRAWEILKDRAQEKASAVHVFTDFSGQRLDPRSLTDDFQECLQKARLAGKISWSNLRHCFARHIARRGVPFSNLYKFMGFSDIARGIIYAAFAAEFWEKDVTDRV